MTADALIHRFYDELWNAQAYQLAGEILSPNVRFKGSLDDSKVGIPGFISYAKSVHSSLSDYTCNIEHIVSDRESCACKMRFSGVHLGDFMGFSPTGKTVSWTGAAFFSVTDSLITEVWVRGDLVGLMAQLESNKW